MPLTAETMERPTISPSSTGSQPMPSSPTTSSSWPWTSRPSLLTTSSCSPSSILPLETLISSSTSTWPLDSPQPPPHSTCSLSTTACVSCTLTVPLSSSNKQRNGEPQLNSKQSLYFS